MDKVLNFPLHESIYFTCLVCAKQNKILWNKFKDKNITMCPYCKTSYLLGPGDLNFKIHVAGTPVFLELYDSFGKIKIENCPKYLHNECFYYFEDFKESFRNNFTVAFRDANDTKSKANTFNSPLLANTGFSKSPNDLSTILTELTEYLEKTNSDKYAASPLNDMLGPDGKAINMFQVKKYLTRYNTKGFDKSELRSDLLKIIHYTMFELLRTKK